METALTSRGYAFLGPGEGARSDFQYWRERQTSQCVGVRYRDNRVTAVVDAPNAECEKAATNKPKAPAPTATGFHTVCGVTVDGKPYRYKCTVEGAGPSGPGQTTLHFPDNTVTLKWLGAKMATATFLFEGKPYYWVSDRRAAELELQSLRWATRAAIMRNQIPAILAGAYTVLGALSILPVFTGDDAMSAIFAVLLGSPWVQLLSSALGAAGMSSPSPAAGLGLAGIGIAVNAAIANLASRWLLRRGTPR